MADGIDIGSVEIAGTKLILNPAAPLDSAREYIHRHHTQIRARTLHHQNGTFYQWHGSHYRECEVEEIRANLWQFLDSSFSITRIRKKDGPNEEKIVPFQPNKSRVANVLEAVAAEAQLPTHNRAPVWLDGRTDPEPARLIAFTNGLLHLPTREIHKHSPDLFAMNALSFPYRADAKSPLHWLHFLNSLWPRDENSISTLQEMFGLFLTGETRHQKAFLIVGPKRSGKGTIARVLTHLIGQPNACGPTLSSISQNFGLAPLIGKRLAVISDARLSGKADQQIIVERLLAITGEDSISIDRKFRDPWTGRLETRFLLLTNEVPKLSDASGALASRFITLILRKSFYGQEDHALTDRLLEEMPGILLWALDGLDRLQKRGFLVTPESAKAVQQEMEDLASPISAFIRECCVVEAGQGVACEELYRCWCEWCRDQNREHVGTVQDFGRNLRAAVPGLAVTNNRTPGGRDTRVRRYEGVRRKKLEDMAADGLSMAADHEF